MTYTGDKTYSLIKRISYI